MSLGDPKFTSKRILFLTGTRADFGKLKPLIKSLQADPQFEPVVFVTGMHMLAKYGHTYTEVEASGLGVVFQYINQNSSDNMDHVLAKTITGLSDYVHEIRPDLMIIHGDRVEALAGACVGALNNILVGHIEGGEVSGTIDEIIRHSVTKLSHIHFVSNGQAKTRLFQMGELESNIHVIGSPDIDVMNSSDLPTFNVVQERYDIRFDDYGILMFHPVTTELDVLAKEVEDLVDCVIESQLNYVVIFPNNDPGNELILDAYHKFEGIKNIRIFPSMRFEYFLTLLKKARFIIGNSSAGIREAPHFGTPTINLGSRQTNRVICDSVLNVPLKSEEIAKAISKARNMERKKFTLFGTGDSAARFRAILKENRFWDVSKQKHFVDRL